MITNPRKFLENILRDTYIKDFNREETPLGYYLPLLIELEEVGESGIWYWDLKNKIQYWSDGYYNFLNVRKRVGKYPIIENFIDANIHPDDIDALCEARKEVIVHKKSKTHEYRTIKKDGSIRYLKSRMNVQLDEHGELVFIVGLEIDVSATRRAIEELKEYRKSVAANEIFLGIGTWELNLDNNKISLSDSFKSLLKYPPNFPSKEIDIYEWSERHIIATERKKFYDIYNSLPLRDTAVIDRMHLMDFDGNEVHVTLFFKMLYNDIGIPVKIIGTTKDVSELEQSERKLEMMVEELNRSNRELEEFAYIASHDLQEPIRKLITFSERINTMFANEIPAAAKTYLDKISKASFNMKHLIENLLEFSRVTRTKNTFEHLSLKQVVEEVIQDFELQIEETHALIECDDLPKIDIVPHQMKQLFLNLIGNSIKFRKKEELLKVKISHRPLTLAEIKNKGLNPKTAYLYIEVSDNGIGFEQEYEEKVFQVFQRLNGKAEYPGTGIGLSICRKVMSFHNGFINVTSELGVGTTFHLILPYEQNKLRV